MRKDLGAIFKAYDVRGVYPSELDEDTARRVGASFARWSEAKRVAVGRDMRGSSPALAAAFIDGVTAAGATFVAETTATQWHQTVKIVKKALQNDGFSFVHVRFPCNENFGAYALGTRDTLKNLEWIEEHTTGRKADGSDSDFRWETGIKHDASNSRPEFSRLLRDLQQRVQVRMTTGSGKGGH
jgi:hypothetical protein